MMRSKRRAAPALVGAFVLLLTGLFLLVDRPARSSASAPVLLAAGDIDGCGTGAATARIINGIDGAVAALGDNAYPSGGPSDYAQCYDKTWGLFKDRTHAVPGNHDYDSPRAPGYFGYFGAAAGPPGKGYYSYDLAGWHMVAINSNCDSIDCNAEGAWLDSDLSAHPAQCTLAYWHHPRYSSGSAGDNPLMNTFWKVLYAHGASVVLNGHDHDYERFAPQDPNGHLDTARGIRQFIVGTGGGPLGSLYAADPNSEIRSNHSFGVLQLTLRPDGYDWKFLPVSAGGFTDSGSDSCHGPSAPAANTSTAPAAPRPPAPPDPNPALPAAPAPAQPSPVPHVDRSGGPASAAAPGPAPQAQAGAITPRSAPPAVAQPAPQPSTSTSSTLTPPTAAPALRPDPRPTATLPPGPDVPLVMAISDLDRAPVRHTRRSPPLQPWTAVAVSGLMLDGVLLVFAGRRPGGRGWNHEPRFQAGK